MDSVSRLSPNSVVVNSKVSLIWLTEMLLSYAVVNHANPTPLLPASVYKLVCETESAKVLEALFAAEGALQK